jgi:ADP-heptose:LPS heptosyltransferase
VILVLRALGVGDLAAAVPALRGLRAAFPDRTLALAAPAWLTPLIDLIGGVDRVVDVDGLQPRRWQLTRPEIAVNLHGRGPQSHRLLAGAAPQRMWAFANVDAGHLDGPTWEGGEHEVKRWCRMLDHYGVATDAGDLSLTAAPSAQPGVTVIHPGAKSPTRRWPTNRFAAVGAALSAAGHRVVVTGSAGERDVAARVAHGAGLPGSAVLAGRTGLRELAGLVAHARLLISGDTGIAHLATAYGTPSVVLFGPVPPRLWGPPPDRPQHRAIWHGTRVDPGDQAAGDVHPALLAIDVDEVLDAAGVATAAASSARQHASSAAAASAGVAGTGHAAATQ